MFHPCVFKKGSLCPPSRLSYYHSPSPDYASQPPAAVTLSYITLSILGALSHVILASFVLYVRVNCRGIFRGFLVFSCFFALFPEVHCWNLLYSLPSRDYFAHERTVIQAPIWRTISFLMFKF